MSNSTTKVMIMQVPAQSSRAPTDAPTSYVPLVTPVEPSPTGRSLLLQEKSQEIIPLTAYAPVCQHRVGRRRLNVAACVHHWNELWKDRCYNNNRPQPRHMPHAVRMLWVVTRQARQSYRFTRALSPTGRISRGLLRLAAQLFVPQASGG
jgi:hypothetical protein